MCFGRARTASLGDPPRASYRELCRVVQSSEVARNTTAKHRTVARSLAKSEVDDGGLLPLSQGLLLES